MDNRLDALSKSLTSLLRQSLLLTLTVFAAGTLGFGQARNAAPAKAIADDLVQMRSSSAFAELQLKRTELASELESLVLDYTEDFPKVKELRFGIILIDRDIAKLSKVKPGEASKLTLALGKLMVRRIELETDTWNLLRSYKEDHPDVKRANRKVEIYTAAINDILN